MRKATTLFALVFALMIQVASGQGEPQIFGVGEVSRFDDLINSEGHGWLLSDAGGVMKNQNTLDALINIYPEGVSWERCSYNNGGKFSKSVDRWIIVNAAGCQVYEWLDWSWGGVFGYRNGVSTKTMDQFDLALKKAKDSLGDQGRTYNGQEMTLEEYKAIDSEFTQEVFSRGLRADTYEKVISPTPNVVGLGKYAPDDFGKYKQDLEITSDDQLFNLPEYRGQTQSAFDKTANGILKGIGKRDGGTPKSTKGNK